jgi:REP element-mobilizing transposase RayT
MTLPREVLPGRFYLVTRRCSQRMFLLRPDAATNNAFVYCLASAAERYEIDVLMTCAMSNHHHTVIFDRKGTYPQFLEHFHKLVARSQNALRGRWEHFWSSGQTSVVRLADRCDVIEKLAYVATNPVKDHLVERAHHWPGVNTFAALRGQRELQARRPRHFFRSEGPMPGERTLKLVIPPELGSAAALIAELVERVDTLEHQAAAQRRLKGTRIVGRRGVLEQHWRDAPETFEPRRQLNPRVAARSAWQRIEAIVRNREFANVYRAARQRWLAGMRAEFPPGTYWLSRFANVAVGVAPS